MSAFQMAEFHVEPHNLFENLTWRHMAYHVARASPLSLRRRVTSPILRVFIVVSVHFGEIRPRLILAVEHAPIRAIEIAGSTQPGAPPLAFLYAVRRTVFAVTVERIRDVVPTPEIIEVYIPHNVRGDNLR